MKYAIQISRVCGLATLLLALACTDPSSKLPEYGKVPQFSMTDSEGHPFHGRQLNGKVWIADVIYTTCPDECPRMTAQMHRLEQQIKGDNGIQLVSISVDPAHDTPPVLNEFAHRYDAPTPQWTFLTGTPDSIHLIAYQTFHVGDVIGKIEHSTKFVLVDKHGDLRGYYSAFDPESMASLLKDAALLQRARS